MVTGKRSVIPLGPSDCFAKHGIKPEAIKENKYVQSFPELGTLTHICLVLVSRATMAKKSHYKYYDSHN